MAGLKRWTGEVPWLATASFVALGFLFGCAEPEPGSPEALYKAEQEKKEERATRAVETVEKMPDWFLKPPRDDISYYSTGTANSADPQLSIDKAIMNAKRSLADRINGAISSKMKEFVSEVGAADEIQVITESERVTTNLVTEVTLKGYVIEETEMLPQSGSYRTFVLMRYPVGEANGMLLDEIKKNRILEVRLRASKGFADLEREIREARKRKKVEGGGAR